MESSLSLTTGPRLGLVLTQVSTGCPVVLSPDSCCGLSSLTQGPGPGLSPGPAVVSQQPSLQVQDFLEQNCRLDINKERKEVQQL